MLQLKPIGRHSSEFSCVLDTTSSMPLPMSTMCAIKVSCKSNDDCNTRLPVASIWRNDCEFIGMYISSGWIHVKFGEDFIQEFNETKQVNQRGCLFLSFVCGEAHSLKTLKTPDLQVKRTARASLLKFCGGVLKSHFCHTKS